jgi:REP element-mobilizing transposase RayT
LPQTHTNLLTHIIFGTKARKRWLDDAVRADVHSYLGGILREKQCRPIIINGTDDHVHVLTALHPKIALADIVGIIKANSSGWLHKHSRDHAAFAWQAGYGAFSVSRSNLDDVYKYIERQEEHHRTLSFHDEYIAFLKKHGIEFDEKYMWD